MVPTVFQGLYNPITRYVCMSVQGVSGTHCVPRAVQFHHQVSSSLVPRPSLSLASAITILEAGKKELVKREEGLVKLVT